jgi:hypothetical protein
MVLSILRAVGSIIIGLSANAFLLLAGLVVVVEPFSPACERCGPMGPYIAAELAVLAVSFFGGGVATGILNGSPVSRPRLHATAAVQAACVAVFAVLTIFPIPADETVYRPGLFRTSSELLIPVMATYFGVILSQQVKRVLLSIWGP